jgi:ribosomal protein L12E/L44/L45/RPP1/RPP2
MKEFYAILPGSNLESQKLVIEMFLNALGTNDVDQVMERLFPANMAAVPVAQQQSNQAQQIAKAVAQLMASGGQGQPPQGGPNPNANTPPPADNEPMRESDPDLTPLAQYRVRRLIRAAEEAVSGDTAATG